MVFIALRSENDSCSIFFLAMACSGMVWIYFVSSIWLYRWSYFGIDKHCGEPVTLISSFVLYRRKLDASFIEKDCSVHALPCVLCYLFGSLVGPTSKFYAAVPSMELGILASNRHDADI